MSVSPLASEFYPSPNCGNYENGSLVKNRTHFIDKITVHHTAGNISLRALGREFGREDRQASSNYGIDVRGNVAAFVDESVRAWTSGNAENDNRAVTIEVANETCAPEWRVSEASFDALVALCADICLRNGIRQLVFTGDKSGNLTLHKYFQATLCPGPYLESRMPELAKRVNTLITPEKYVRPQAESSGEAKSVSTDSSGTDANSSGGSGADANSSGAEKGEKLYRVQVGAFRVKANAERLLRDVKLSGRDAFLTESGGVYRVQVGAFRNKAGADSLANELKSEGRKVFVKETYSAPAAGQDPDVPSGQNNGVPSGQDPADGKADSPAPGKTTDELAREVIRGLWGNGAERKRRLTEAGYDYTAVQSKVNAMMKTP